MVVGDGGPFRKTANFVEEQGVECVDEGFESVGTATEFVAVFAGGFFDPGKIAGYQRRRLLTVLAPHLPWGAGDLD